jgi:cytochrome P450 family 109
MNSRDAGSATIADEVSGVYDPLDPVVKQNPYPYYVKLRRDEPVKWLEGLKAFSVARYDDIDVVLKDSDVYSSAQFWPALLGEYDPYPNDPPFISMDPPGHTHLRKLANKAFMPSRINLLRERALGIANELFDDIVKKHGPEGEFDFAWDFAALFPVTVFAEVLGIPTARRAEFKVWVDDIIAAANRASYGPERLAQIRKSSDTAKEFFEALYEERVKNLGDDIISTLITAEVDGQKLSRSEVLSTAILLLIGGVETTTNILGNTFLELHRHPEVYARVRADLSLIPALLEEVLRFNPSVHIIFRNTTRDTVLAGVPIPKGSAVMPLIACANRDESKFSDPETFNIDRKIDVPLMTFGQGPHFCIGNYLMRMETRAAMEVALQRFETLMPLSSDNVEWIDSYFARGPHHLTVRYKVRGA